MRKWLLVFLLLIPRITHAQISGAGNIGCSGVAVAGTNITSATANNTVVSTLANFPAWGVLVQLDQGTTITGGAVTFNLSNDGGTNYSAVPVAQVLNPSTFAQLTNPYTLVASTNQSFLVILNGASNFQVKLTTAMTGTGTITPYITAICTQPQGHQFDASGNEKININAQSLAKVLVTPDSVALPANQSVNEAQINGATPDMNSGTKSGGTQRVVIATDQPTMTNPQPVTLGTETTKVIGTVRNLGNAGAIFDGATGAAPPANVLFLGGLKSGATGGLLSGITVCDLDFSINISTATTTLAVTGVSGRQVRICSFSLLNNAADNVAFIEGTGATCGTGTAGMAGGSTAAAGFNLGANSGLTQGSGLGEVMTTATAGDSVCIATSAATQLSGHMKYTIY